MSTTKASATHPRYLSDEEAAAMTGLTVDRIRQDKNRAVNPLPYLPIGKQRKVVAATLLSYYRDKEVGSRSIIETVLSEDFKQQLKREILADLFPEVTMRLISLSPPT